MEKYTNNREDILIEVTENHLCATMTIKRDNGFITQDEILDLIAKAGISNGFIPSIDQEGEKELYHPFKIAEVPAIDQEVRLDLYYDSEELLYAKTPINEANIFKLVYVQKGSAIGKLSYDEDMFSRKDVYGNYLLTLEGRKKLIDKYRGDNLDFNLESREFIASKSGYLSLSSDGKYNITNHLYIEHDIDRDYGNIYVLGNLTINGNVSNVRHIRVIGQLTINGNVFKSNLYGEHGISINGSLENCNGAGVTCPQSIECGQIKSSKVFSGKDLTVSGDVFYSSLVGEISISLIKEAKVIASNLQSSRFIQVYDVRNEGDTCSELEISVSPYTKQQLMILTRELVYFNENDSQNEKVAIIKKEIKQLEELLSNKVEEAIDLDNRDALMIKSKGKLGNGVRLKILKESLIVTDTFYDNKEIINLR
jgi:uncharacterized protein (DUF342 family)